MLSLGFVLKELCLILLIYSYSEGSFLVDDFIPYIFQKDISFDSFHGMNHVANLLIDCSEGSFFVTENNSLIRFFVFDPFDPFSTINFVVSSLINCIEGSFIVTEKNAFIVFCL